MTESNRCQQAEPKTLNLEGLYKKEMDLYLYQTRDWTAELAALTVDAAQQLQSPSEAFAISSQSRLSQEMERLAATARTADAQSGVAIV